MGRGYVASTCPPSLTYCTVSTSSQAQRPQMFTLRYLSGFPCGVEGYEQRCQDGIN